MESMLIHLNDNRTGFRPGEEISGEARWELDRQPSDVVLKLMWFTRGKGDGDSEIDDEIEFSNVRQNDRREFSFEAPDSPYSFSGKLISIIWVLELTALPSKTTTKLEITVSPSRKEVLAGSLKKI